MKEILKQRIDLRLTMQTIREKLDAIGENLDNPTTLDSKRLEHSLVLAEEIADFTLDLNDNAYQLISAIEKELVNYESDRNS